MMRILRNATLALRSRCAGQLKERNLQVVESVSLGGRKHVHLLRCGDRHYLVGVGTDSVHCIKEAKMVGAE